MTITNEPINDITVPPTVARNSKSWNISYNTVSGGGECGTSGGINTASINTKSINGCPTSDLVELLWDVSQTYVQGDKIFELTQSYSRALDATLLSFELTQEYAVRYSEMEVTQSYPLDSGGANVVESEITQEYLIVSDGFVEELLYYVNEHRGNFGLVQIGRWRGEGPDIAQIHSHDMATDSNQYHDHVDYSAGNESFLDDRLPKTKIADGATSGSENLATGLSSKSLSVFAPNYQDVTPWDIFYSWKLSPGHNANMLWDWNAEDYPEMSLGLASNNVKDHNNFPTLPDNIYVGFFATQNFFGYGIPSGAVLDMIELTQEWNLTGALIRVIDQEYAMDAYTPASAQHSTSYSVKVTATLSAPFSYKAAAQHSAPIQYTISARHTAPYISLDAVVGAHESPYDMPLDRAIAQHEAAYPIKVSTTHEAPYGPMVQVQGAHSSYWQDMRTVAKAMNSTYSILQQVSKQLPAPYGDVYFVNAQHESLWAADSPDTVRAQHEDYWSIASDSVVSGDPNVVVTVGSEVISVIELAISSSEDRPLWQCKMILEDLSHYSKFIEGATFTVDLSGDVYSFLYHTKSVNRSGPGESSVIVEGMSQGLSLQSPRSDTITKDYDTDMEAQALIEDILGQSVVWDFPAWTIPARTVASNEAIPLDLAKTIVEAAGGVLYSKIDGQLAVRKKYIVNTNLYAGYTEDQVYADLEDNLSAIEGYEVRHGYNTYRVTDTDPSYGDRLEFIAEDGSDIKGVLRAYPTPHRESIEIGSTDPGSILLTTVGWAEREEEEVVEFVSGQASLRYPAQSISTVSWFSESLGGILHTAYESDLLTGTTVNNGYGLASVTYTVRYLEADTVGVEGLSVQYVIEDEI